MKKKWESLVISGSLVFLSLGPTLRARQQPADPQADSQQAASQPQEVSRPAEDAARVLKRGDVLMPNDPLLVKLSEHQTRSQKQYKSTTFEQKAIIERYKADNNLQKPDEVTKHREIVVRYSPDGNGELQPTLISDNEGNEKTKEGKEAPDGNRSKSLAEKLISPILFPMTTENVQKCKFTVLLALPDMVLLRFEPEAMNTDPIFAGHVFVNPRTGEMYRLEITDIYNFEKIDGRFKHLKRFNVTVDYTEQPGGYRFPTYMEGNGFAKVAFFKGDFRFTLTESGYSTTSAALNPDKT